MVGVPACGDNHNASPDGGTPDGTPPDGTPVATKFGFPQGVASGDPRATSVVLWTRAVPTEPAAAVTAGVAVSVKVQVSSDAAFATLVVDETVTATQASDHTVRVLVTGLTAGIPYYYKFTAGTDTISGRTRTAPAATADVQVNLAWMSCQDYTAGHYGAYRQLIVDDDARPEADKIHAVVHLGDMIYETRGNDFQTALSDDFEPIMLKNRDGSDRAIAPFPSGGGTSTGSGTFAVTVDDYRHLYKTFFSDPDIQAARARWPFVSIWDDHEFTDDCWQSQANYNSADTIEEPSQSRRYSASQAWFEFMPVQLTGAVGVEGVANEAKDFSAATVVNAAFTPPNADNFVPEPNNVAAIGAISIYRSFRFGKHVELVMTDERSYRSDHAIPEALTNNAVFFAPRGLLPLPLVNIFDQGSTATTDNGHPPTSVTFTVPGKDPIVFPNVRHDSPVGTMLGKQQKAWWKATMKQSDATWKLWGNEVTLMRLKIQQLGPADVSDRVVTGDSWDGYASERNELMTYLRTENIKNVVVLSGDIHAAFAGTLMENFDATDAQPPVACELVGPGVTSNSLYSVFEFSTRPPVPEQLRSLVVVDASANGGTKFTENLNMLLLQGTAAAGTFAGNIAQGALIGDAILAAAQVNTHPNPHLQYVDTNAQGYGYVKITADQVAASINTINRPIAAASDTPPGIKRTANITIPKNNPAGMVTTVTGTNPFPLI